MSLHAVDESYISNIHVSLNTNAKCNIIATVSFNYAGMICTDIKIINANGTRFTKYPPKFPRDGTARGKFHPANNAVREMIDRLIFAAVDEELEKLRNKLEGMPPAPINTTLQGEDATL